MSVQWLSWVFDSVDVVGSQRLVLLSLANHADDRGICWPSIDTVAKEARLSRRRVEGAIRGLVATGIVKRTVNGAPVPGSNRPNLYRLNKAPDEVSGAKPSVSGALAPDEVSTPAPDGTSPQTISRTIKEPSVNPCRRASLRHRLALRPPRRASRHTPRRPTASGHEALAHRHAPPGRPRPPQPVPAVPPRC